MDFSFCPAGTKRSYGWCFTGIVSIILFLCVPFEPRNAGGEKAICFSHHHIKPFLSKEFHLKAASVGGFGLFKKCFCLFNDAVFI